MSYFSLCLDEVWLKLAPYFIGTCFVVPIITVIVEQAYVVGYGLDHVNGILIIDWLITFGCNFFYLEISKQVR